MFVLGTSLTVQPFASLIDRVPESCPRVLFNLESVGEASARGLSRLVMSGGASEGFDFDGRTGRQQGIRDVRFIGTSDEGVRELCRALGWERELDELYERETSALDVEAAVERAELEASGQAEQAAALETSKDGVAQAVGDAADKAASDKRVENDDDRDVDELTKDVEKVRLDTVEPEAKPVPKPGL